MKGNMRIVSGGANIDKTGLSERSQRTINVGYTSVATGLSFTLAGSGGNLLVSTAHGMRSEDRIRFTSGDLIGREFLVIDIPTVNNFTVNHTFTDLPADADTFDHLRPVTAKLSADGGIPVSVVINSEANEDSAASSGDVGSVALGVRQDTLTADTSADGDYSFLKVNQKGEQYIKDTDALAALVTMTALLGGDFIDVPVRRDMTSSAVPTGSWTTVTTLANTVKKIYIHNNSGSDFMLGKNGSQIGVIPAGADAMIVGFAAIATDTVDLQAYGANATSGKIYINYFG